MSRAQRLLDLIQVLRRHRHPVSGAVLAESTGVSLRTLYRDIGSLKAQGAAIEGEAGFGYVLKPGFALPPLMFSMEEVEALALGARWVERRPDPSLARAARDALAKIGAVVSAEGREDLEASTLLIGPGAAIVDGDTDLATIRTAIRRERKLAIAYRNRRSSYTERTIWPFALGFFDNVRIVAAWCELREGFRHFRTDRIAKLSLSDQRYPRRRQALFKEWRALEGIAPE